MKSSATRCSGLFCVEVNSMRIAVIADIHSNYAALEACLESARHEKADGIVFLGDYVSDCPYPQKTLALIKQAQNEFQTWLIRGNREEYLIHHHYNNSGWQYSSSSGSLLYTYENLIGADITFFESLPITLKIEPEGCKPFTVCHGSPFKVRDEILGHLDRMDESLHAVDTDLLICGHTHLYWKTSRNGKTILFSPSIGLPTDGLDSRYLMLEYKNGVWNDRNVFITYDKQSFINNFHTSGLCGKAFYFAKSIIKMLESNRNITMQCLKLAEKYYKEDGNADLHHIPEKYWEKAAKELGIE
jgi:putative phosphoesterase